MAFRNYRLAAACLAALLSTTPALAVVAVPQVHISQVYGGGGNSGATFKQDFIELFNAGSTPVSLAGWSVQYASATGSTWQATNLGGVTLQPGQYYLVQEAAGAGTQPNLPTPDANGTLAMSGSAGKVALVASTTLLSGTCPAALEVVGYGATSNCGTPAPGLANATADQRKTAGCTVSGDNSADFEALSPLPRNTATAVNTCAASTDPTDPSVTVAASPSTATIGESVLLTATVVPGTNPTSSNVVVLADLSGIGGDASQRLRDEGTEGDVAAGDNIFSYAQTIAAGTTGGTHALPIGVGDAEGRTATATLNVSVATIVQIHDVQGSGIQSPLKGQVVVTEGIVTARRTTGFFIQSASPDADPLSSEGVFVYTGAAPPASAAVGNLVRVQATVSEFIPSSAPHQLPLTELVTPSVSTLSTGNALPAAVALDNTVLRGDQLHSMERLEGMRVSADLAVAAPGGGFITETSATSTTDGVFYGTLPGTPRPMREPGVSVLDTTPFPIGVTPPVFDGNPELLRVQTTGLAGTTAIAVDVGDAVNGLVGVLDYGFGAYNLLPDTVAFPPVVVVGGTPRAVTTAANDEITIGGFNLLRFFDDANDPATGEPVLTTAALNHRLAKTANAICKYVKAPDILGVVEVENLSVLQKLATAINTGATQEPGACAHNPQYEAFLEEGNDVGGIDVGFLVSKAAVAAGVERVEVLGIEQLGKDDVLDNPDGTTTLLNDRPSLLLRARVHQANGAARDLSVLVNHLRSLSDVDSTDAGTNGWATVGTRVRAKRAAQAKYVADIVQARQAANPNELLVLLGDFNAFEFNDGYVDTMGIITGNAAPSGTVMNYVASPVARPLLNLASIMPEAERYSFSFDGSAQSLDHLLVSQSILDAGFGIRGEHPRINADFGEDNFGDWTVPVRVSDHDPVVLYLRDPAFASADLAVAAVANDTHVAPGATTTFGVGVANGGPDAATPARVAIRVDAAGVAFSVDAPPGWACDAPVADPVVGQRIDCGIGALAPGALASFAVSVEAPSPGGGALGLQATVDTSSTDAASGNDLANASVAVDAPVDLAVAVVPSSPSVTVGSIANFGVAVGNGSTHAAASPTLEIGLSKPIAGVQVDADAGWTCDAPVVDAGATRVHCAAASFAPTSTASFVVHVPAGDALGESRVTLSATAGAATADPDATNNSARDGIDVHAVADMRVRTVAPLVPPGSTAPATYVIEVANSGPNTARGVAVAMVVNTTVAGVLGVSAPGWTCAGVNHRPEYSLWTCQRDAFAIGVQAHALSITLDPALARRGGRLNVATAVATVSTDPNAHNNASAAWSRL